jgi:hypothetical protein
MCELAHAEEPHPTHDNAERVPSYTLDVDSDAPDVVSFEALAVRIGADLGAHVVRPGAIRASRAAITIRYRDGKLVVRADHADGRSVERSIVTEGDDATIQHDAVLLASNLARDEASEILDTLIARRTSMTAITERKPSAASEAPETKPGRDEGHHPVTASLFFPLATNFERPNTRSNLHLSLLYGRVGASSGVMLGGAVLYASRRSTGVQMGGVAAASDGPVAGAQLSGAINYAKGDVAGLMMAGAVNVTSGRLDGAQLVGAVNIADGGAGVQASGGLNLTLEDTSGAQIAGGANIATRSFEGAQIASINIAESVSGTQLGVINIARKVRGTQLGIVNIAEEVDGAAIGVVSVSKGGIHPIVWGSNLQYMNAGIKFATKHAYTLAAVHYGTIEGNFDNVGVTAAIGGHVTLPAHFDIELQGSTTHLVPRPSQSTKSGNVWVAPQVIAGYSFAPHLRVFAGGGIRFPLSVDLGRDVRRPEVLAGIQF